MVGFSPKAPVTWTLSCSADVVFELRPPDPHAVAESASTEHGDDARGCTQRHMPSISRSTRSSWERKGSLHSTVRWAWSLSLRCTQSTVKSRRRSCARLMKLPRSRARVVCGGTDLARKMSRSLVTRLTAPRFSSR